MSKTETEGRSLQRGFVQT